MKHIRRKRIFGLCFSIGAASLQLTTTAIAVETGSGKLSLSQFDYLIGNWSCNVTEPGKPETQSSISFEWLYDKKVLKETVTAGTYSGQFFTTLDKRNNKFKGVAIANDGGYIVWENPGLADNRASEVGYLFAAGKMIAVSRSDSEKISDSHYVIRDFGPDSASGGKGVEADTEDCTKHSIP
jgi:hypothetical protein